MFSSPNIFITKHYIFRDEINLSPLIFNLQFFLFDHIYKVTIFRHWLYFLFFFFNFNRLGYKLFHYQFLLIFRVQPISDKKKKKVLSPFFIYLLMFFTFSYHYINLFIHKQIIYSFPTTSKNKSSIQSKK